MNIVTMIHLWLWSLFGQLPDSAPPPPPPSGEVEAAAGDSSSGRGHFWSGPLYINNGY
jgi:hypothetical protein